MTQDRSASPRRGRWWLVGGLAVALLLVSVAVVYAGTRKTEDRESGATDPAGLDQPSAWPSIPPGLLPTEQPVNSGWALCTEVQSILRDMIGVDVDYVETRRTAADRLRELAAPTPTHQALLDDLADELDAAAQLVADDPDAEPEAFDREDAASVSFINSGGCD